MNEEILKYKKKREQIRKNINENLWIYLGILFSIFTLFFCIRYIVLGSHDDIALYVDIVTGREWEDRFLGIAYHQGRICMLIAAIFHTLPLYFNSWMVYKIFSYLGILFTASGLFLLLYRHVNRESAFLSVLFFFAFAQLDREQHNVLICYIGALQIVMGFALYAIERYITFLKTRKKSSLIIACILLILSAILYESYIAIVGILFLICIFYRIKKDEKLNFKSIIRDIFVPMFCAIVYVVVYFAWRIYYPSVYEGTSIDSEFDLIASIRTMLTFSFGKFPGVDAFQIYNLSFEEMLPYLNSVVVLNAIIVTIAFIVILKHSQDNFTLKKIIIIMGLAFITVCIPTCIHALTPKYKAWVDRGTTSYVPSISCFFIIAGLLAILILYLYQIIKFKRTFLTFFSIIVFYLTLTIGISNNFHAEYYMNRQADYQVIRSVLDSKYINDEVENGSQIYFDNLKRALGMEIVEKYVLYERGKTIISTTERESLDFSKPVYEVHFSDNNAAYIGRIDDNYIAQELCLIFLTENEVESINLVSSSTNVSLDFVGDSENANIYNNTYSIFSNLPDNVGTEVKMICDDVFISECEVSSETIKENTGSLYQIDYPKGFYGEERDGNTTWRWCQKEGIISFYNFSKEPVIYYISFDYKLGSKDGKLKGKFGGIDFEFAEALSGHVDIPVILDQGVTNFEFIYTGSNVNAPNDSRQLSFRLDNFEVNSTNKKVTSFIKGLYSTEKASKDMLFNWSDQVSFIEIYNLTNKNIETKIDFKLGIEDNETFMMNVNDFDYIYENSYNMMPIRENFSLLPGKNTISFSSTTSRIDASNDTRALYFRMFDFNLFLSNKTVNEDLIKFELIDGFYNIEEHNGETWNWCQSEGRLQLKSAEDKMVRIGFLPSIPYEEVYTLCIEYENEKYEYMLSKNSEYIVIDINIKKGINDINFSTNAPQIDAPNDSRALYFRLFNLEVIEIDDVQ